MNKLEELENKMLKSMESTFEGCYSCIRVWSAWSYGTMEAEDFIPFDKDDEIFAECFNKIKEDIIKTPVKNEDEFYDKVIDVVSNYTLYYNENIDRNFRNDAFNDDIFGIVDLKDMYKNFKEYQDVVTADSKPVRKTKIKP